MAKKRAATFQLTETNWNEKLEEEKEGVIAIASEDVLKTRVIKTAKRNSTGGSGGGTNSPFSGFTGFKTINSPVSSPFAFLNQNTTNNVSSTIKDTTTNAATKNSSEKTNSNQEGEKKNEDLQLLKDLNVCCSNWIAEHVQKTPFCILTPIFKDYERHLSKLKLEMTASSDAPKETTVSAVVQPQPNESKQEPKPSPFANVFGTGMTGFTAPTLGAFGAPSFLFGNNKDAQKPEDNTNADAEDEPPKNEFTPVVEENSVYSIRCKVFVKKDKEFVSRGVGTLYLKQVKETKKIQLLVRADTNLGNVLINVWLTATLPIQKTGPNNITLVCLPTPDSKPPPSTVLIRVKTTEERDRTVSKMEELRAS